MTDSAWGDVTVRALSLSHIPSVHIDLLQEAERARASKYLHRRDAVAFLAGRLALHSFAADLADVPINSLSAKYHCGTCGDNSGDHGKPGYVLADGSAGPLVSLSRAGNWLLLAGAPRGHALAGLGVDAELATRTGFEGFDAFLTPSEASGVLDPDTSAGLRQRARLWARKEAFVKALGVGLARDPASVDVSENVLEGVLVTDLDGGRLGLPSDLVAALAVRAHPHAAVAATPGL